MRTESKEAREIIRQLEERNKEIEYRKLPDADEIIRMLE